MSKMLMKVLGNYNQQLTAALVRAEQEWPALCLDEDAELTEQAVEEQRRALLLAMTYLEQLQRLLNRSPYPPPPYAEQAAAPADARQR